MELSRQMLLLTAENYGSYYLHITKQEILLPASGDSTYYNLNGQRVGRDYHGIVIHRGKKIINK